MMFILLVAAILLVRFYPHAGLQFVQDGLTCWHRALDKRLPAERFDRWKLYLQVASPVLVLLIVLGLLKGFGWVWGIYLASFLVLLGSFGVSGLKGSVAVYVDDLKRNDVQAAYHDAAALSRQNQESEAQSWTQLHDETLEVVANRFYECYFPVIFWFVILGAPGALLYRAVVVFEGLADVSDRPRLQRIQGVLDWLPCRVFGISLAVVGNFRPVMNQLSATALDYRISTAKLITRYIRAAIIDGNTPVADVPGQEVFELEELPRLIDRALVTWIAAVGLLAVF